VPFILERIHECFAAVREGGFDQCGEACRRQFAAGGFIGGAGFGAKTRTIRAIAKGQLPFLEDFLAMDLDSRDAGWLALLGGLAGGADEILIPEVEFDLDEVAARLQKRIVLWLRLQLKENSIFSCHAWVTTREA
jgi:hypothetical protein